MTGFDGEEGRLLLNAELNGVKIGTKKLLKQRPHVVNLDRR
jgi:hypothetical protein